MAEETTTASGPLDAGSSDASGLPAQAGEHSVEQNVLALDAESNRASGLPTGQTGLPAAPSLPVPPADAAQASLPAPAGLGRVGGQAGEPALLQKNPSSEVPTPGTEVKELQKDALPLPPIQIQIPQPPQKTADAEIARMISEIKLPERRVETGSAAPPRTFDTALGASISAQKEKSGVTPEAALDIKQPPEENPPDSAPQEIRKDKPASLSSLHTLKDDLQSVVRDKKISLVRAAAYEQDKRSRQDHSEESPAPQPGHKRIVLATVSAIFLLLALGSAAFFFVYSKEAEKQSAASPVNTSLIFAEKTAPFPVDELSDIDIKRSLSQARNVSNSLGSIVHIVPIVRAVGTDGAVRDTPLSIGEFFTAINAQATPELTRSLKGDFFLGIHTSDTNAPFLIIPILSYERAFAGMLEWEQALNDDLAPFFTPASLPITDESGLFVESRFEDIVINNYDVRALINDSGEIQMFYSFPTRNILIIAENPNSFLEILSRLRANRQL